MITKLKNQQKIWHAQKLIKNKPNKIKLAPVIKHDKEKSTQKHESTLIKLHKILIQIIKSNKFPLGGFAP